MNITIEDNELIYIYFIDRREFGIVDGTYVSVKCHLLFDEQDHWVGVEILNKDFEGEFELPPIKTIDFPLYNSVINQHEDRIEILFDKDYGVSKKIKQDCNIDIYDGQIYGIEIIVWTFNDIGSKSVVSPFVSRDI